MAALHGTIELRALDAPVTTLETSEVETIASQEILLAQVDRHMSITNAVSAASSMALLSQTWSVPSLLEAGRAVAAGGHGGVLDRHRELIIRTERMIGRKGRASVDVPLERGPNIYYLYSIDILVSKAQ